MSRRIWHQPGWAARLAQFGLLSVEALLDGTDVESRLPGACERLDKPGLDGRIRLRWRPAGGDVFYLKRYARTGLRQQLDRILRQTLRHSRAAWEFEVSGQLARQSIPAVRAVAAAEDVAGAIERSSLLVLEAVPGEALDRLWPKLEQRRAAVTRGRPRHDLIERLGRLVCAFHQTGFTHRDLYLCHIFAEVDESGMRPACFWLIDLGRVIRPGLRRMRWILKDLGQLDSSARQLGASRSDRWRFLRAYLGLGTGALRARWYARRIERRSGHILAREARRAGRR